MKIAVIAHIRHPIAEPFMGGMEAHCRMLCDGLRESGHDVTLFGAAGSRDAALVPICEAPYEEVLPWEDFRGTDELAEYQNAAFARAWEYILSDDFDVVHNNSLYPQIMDWAARDAVACVTSQHVPPFGPMHDAVLRNAEAPHLAMTVTSRSQLSLWDRRCRDSICVVHNGINCDEWIPDGPPDDYIVWAGRITLNKGTAEAVQAARMAGARLQIYGPVEDRTYFARKVEPHLGEGVEYCGHCTADTLRPVLARAKAALVTPRWSEPFGLVAAEALSCGTPVCAFDMGALSEVVGDCGFVVPEGDVAALAHAIGRADEIERAACRQRALERFSVQAMIAGYQSCYDRVTRRERQSGCRSFAL